MIKKLSKSACEKWMQCPFSYYAHYILRIRPIRLGSPLVFGSGMDVGFNTILLKNGDPLEEYQKEVAKTPIGFMIPHRNDYDGELLSDDDKEELLLQCREFGYSGDNVDDLAEKLNQRIKDNTELTDNQYKAIDTLSRASLAKKAELMFKAYKAKVLPYITEVYSVQKQAGPGVLDVTALWSGMGKRIIDHKTSSKFYQENEIEYSAQLAMYADEEKINDVTYVVLLKDIKKNRTKICSKCGHDGTGKRHKTCDALINKVRCDGEWSETIYPEAEIQILHGTVTNEAMAVASELQREVGRAVEAKIFPCNVQQCNRQFGKPCIYRDLKWKGDMTGLQKVENSNERIK